MGNLAMFDGLFTLLNRSIGSKYAVNQSVEGTVSDPDDYFRQNARAEGVLNSAELETDIKMVRAQQVDFSLIKDILSWDYSNTTQYLRRVILTSFFVIALGYIDFSSTKDGLLYGLEVSSEVIGDLTLFLTIWLFSILTLYITLAFRDLWRRHALIGVTEKSLKTLLTIFNKWREDMNNRGVKIALNRLLVGGRVPNQEHIREVIDKLNYTETFRVYVIGANSMSKIIGYLDLALPVLATLISVYLLQQYCSLLV